jgi:hypothetical protein
MGVAFARVRLLALPTTGPCHFETGHLTYGVDTLRRPLFVHVARTRGTAPAGRRTT